MSTTSSSSDSESEQHEHEPKRVKVSEKYEIYKENQVFTELFKQTLKDLDKLRESVMKPYSRTRVLIHDLVYKQKCETEWFTRNKGNPTRRKKLEALGPEIEAAKAKLQVELVNLSQKFGGAEVLTEGNVYDESWNWLYRVHKKMMDDLKAVLANVCVY